jgi:outer membrane biosynthesis protein TonB
MIRAFIIVCLLSAIAIAQRTPSYTILKKEENLEGVVVVTFKCLDGSVISIQCLQGETVCGLDRVSLDSALKKRCTELVPPTPRR